MENRGIEIVERIEINELNFPDVIFREEYVRKFDKDKDGYLSNEEINEVTENLIEKVETVKTEEDLKIEKSIDKRIYKWKEKLIDLNYVYLE